MNGSLTDDLALAGQGSTRRFAIIDALRGAALVGMFIYHFAWDLLFFGFIAVDVEFNLGWRLFAHFVAATFLALVGVSLVLATRAGFRPTSFLRRFWRIVAAAALISAVTYGVAQALNVPDIFIYFGVLHAIAVASVVALIFLRSPSFVVALAAGFCFLAPEYLRSEFFDEPYWWWLGLSNVVNSTVDYVPILPWAGATLVGLLIGRAIVALEPRLPLLAWQPHSPLGKMLVQGGRWSLAIYLAHQPVLFGLAYLMALLRGRA